MTQGEEERSFPVAHAGRCSHHSEFGEVGTVRLVAFWDWGAGDDERTLHFFSGKPDRAVRRGNWRITASHSLGVSA